MKATILLRLLIPFCGFVIANAKDEDTKKKISIPKAITEIKSKLAHLENFRVEQFTKMQTFMTHIRIINHDLLLSNLTAELNNIRTAVNTTKEEGKETENCFEAATKCAEEIRKATESTLLECVHVSLYDFINRSNISNKIQAEAKGIIDQLSATLFTCSSRRFDKRQCFVLRSKESTDRFKRFHETFNWYLNYHEEIVKRVSDQANSCLHKSLCESTKRIADMQVVAKTCIEDARDHL
uniref:Venom protein n=1 Tax=Ampulex compressa TaxID=860918 RepID=A0A1W6EW71_AMPCP|nr:venom protein [Ampulex compressa]